MRPLLAVLGTGEASADPERERPGRGSPVAIVGVERFEVRERALITEQVVYRCVDQWGKAVTKPAESWEGDRGMRVVGALPDDWVVALLPEYLAAAREKGS